MQLERLANVLSDQFRRSRRQGDRLRVPDPLSESPQARVIRSKIVPPLTDAMSFIDRQQLDPDLVQGPHEGDAAQTFRSDIDQSVLPPLHPLNSIMLLSRIQRTVDKRRRDPQFNQRINLVFHQCDQRTDDNRQTVPSDGGQLVTEAFSS